MKAFNVLIADDNKDLADCLAVMLKEEGFSVTTVYSGETAIAKVGEGFIDLALVDVKLPGMNGVEVLRAINKLSPSTRCIVMTGYRVDQLIAEAIDSGAVHVLRKPFPMDTLIDIVNDVQEKGIILIADDDPDFAKSTADFLASNGYRALIAYTGKDAVDRVVNDKVGVLILDLKLPVIHGLDVYLELGERRCLVPTIIVTGYATQESEHLDVLRSMSVTGCLFKPFDPKMLLAGIESVLKIDNRAASASSADSNARRVALVVDQRSG
jgi:two-component system response regulator HydG